MPTILRNVRIITDGGRWPKLRQIVVHNGRITRVCGADEHVEGGEVFDFRGALVMPGHINAHAHNHEIYLKGTGWGMPLEPYILANSARALQGSGLSDEELYDRTLASAIEMLRNGITGVADDVIHPWLRRSSVEAVLHAYADCGIRARMSLMVEDSPWRRSIPLSPDTPSGHDSLLDDPPHEAGAALSLYRSLLEDWGGHSRVGLMVSPSAPQRCSPDFLHSLADLAREYAVPFHVHIQETLSQYVHGPELFDGRSMIKFMADEGLLGAETMIAHAIWVNDEDISAIAASGASVVHNPVSNAKLGSGVARIRDLMSAGINVALGTDGLTCNDALDIFEVSKTGALLSCLATTDASRWLRPAEVFRAATMGGAVAARLGRVGRIEPGYAADMVFLDPHSYAFVPHNDVIAQTVFSARSRDVRHVMVDGVFRVQDGKYVGSERCALNERVSQAAERFWTEAKQSVVANNRLLPYVNSAYEQAVLHVQNDPDAPYRLVPPLPTIQ